MKSCSEYTRLLPVNGEKRLALPHFPTAAQAVIFRCWESVPVGKLAAVLQASTEEVNRQARLMGLLPQSNTSQWKEKGYITVIRALWHLLPYSQLLELMDWDEEQLAFILKEDDFLDVKLGGFKPACSPVVYRELTGEEELKTAEIKGVIEKLTHLEEERAPFDFFPVPDDGRTLVKRGNPGAFDVILTDEWTVIDRTGFDDSGFQVELFKKEIEKLWNLELAERTGTSRYAIVIKQTKTQGEPEYHQLHIWKNHIEITVCQAPGVLRALFYLIELTRENGGPFFREGKWERNPVFKNRIIYSFCGLYTTALEVSSEAWCPDELLLEYAKSGVNGIWIQAILNKLIEFPFDSGISRGWEERLSRLGELAARAKRYGIRIFLYLNEPRSMPLAFFEAHPALKGHVKGSSACLCTSVPEVMSWLCDSVRTICRAVPDLGGFFTITLSENQSNCYSFWETNCPRCKKRTIADVVSELNTEILRAVRSVSENIDVFAWTWGWEKELFAPDEQKRCIEQMTNEIIVTSVAENRKPYDVGGVRGVVLDYSLSVSGCSDISLERWENARLSGHETAAKIQINTTWEASTLPFIPVFRTVLNIMKELQNAGVQHLFLSWTLGGWPSPNIKLAASRFFDNGERGISDEYKTLYGKYSELVRQSTDWFCSAMSHFPFSVRNIYFGPANGGVSNLLFEKPTGFTSTMTCYAYDDLLGWRVELKNQCGEYPEDVFENQFRLICEDWLKGLTVLRGKPDCELRDIAEVGYATFRSSYNQIRFIRRRNQFLAGERLVLDEIREILTEEKKFAETVYRIMLKNPSVGFEAANHYYFSRQAVLEKIINCDYLLKIFF